MIVKKLVCIAVWLYFSLFITAELQNVRAYECIAPARQNCLQCHTRGDIHSYHWTQLGLTDPSECLLCHCGDVETSPCENVPGYGPVETVCCTSCHEKCTEVVNHQCLSCHSECTSVTTIPVQTMHDSMCRKCHAAGSLHAQPEHNDCALCHSGGVGRAGNVDAASCTALCHPTGIPGTCNLVNNHDAVRETDCVNCHQACVVTTSTTTTMPDCTITISPRINEVYSGQTVRFTAETSGEGCQPAVYEWKLDTVIGSRLDSDGRYAAGFNNTDQPVTDTIVVNDTANKIILEWPVVVRFEKITRIVPATLWRSKWFILPQVMNIQGEGTHFNNERTVVMFYPAASVIPSWQTVLSETLIWNYLLVMPGWYAEANDEEITLVVMTDDEVLTTQIAVDQFPIER